MTWTVANHGLIAMVELSLAMVLFHRAIPSSLKNFGRPQAVMIWLLAIALAMFGTGRMYSFFYADGHGHWIYNFGHYAIITLGVVAYRRAIRYGVTDWWDIGEHGRRVNEPHI